MNELCNSQLWDCADGVLAGISNTVLMGIFVPLALILFFALIVSDVPQGPRDTKTPLLLIAFVALVVAAFAVAGMKGIWVLGLWVLGELQGASISTTQFGTWLGAVILFSIGLKITTGIRNGRWNDQ